MASFTPTAEQRDIFDAFTTGDDLVVVAGAGAGKTATLMLAAEATRNRRGIYIAYNRALADEAKEKFTEAGLKVDCRTAHSLAFREVGVKFKHRFDAATRVRMSAAQVGAELKLPRFIELGAVVLDRARLASQVKETVKRFMQSMATGITADHIPHLKGMEDRHRDPYAKVILPAAQRLWEDLSDPKGTLPFDQDVYLALWARTNPILKADYVMLDESQDASAEIAHVFTTQPMQKVAVGDPNQQLYAWRGARSAIEGMPEGTKELRLTQSFRFGPAVADEANEWLEDLGSDLRIEGTEAIDSRILDEPMPLRTADASLHRTNASAMDAAIAAISSGVKVAVAGGVKEMQALARAAEQLQQRGSTTHPDLVPFSSWQEVVEYSEGDDGADLKPLVRMVNQHGARGLQSALAATVDEDHADLVVSTAHKSKGRQWSRVRIGDDFPEPGSKRSTRDQKMLAYVAVTRAQHVLDPGSLRRDEMFDDISDSIDSADAPTVADSEPQPEAEVITLAPFDIDVLSAAIDDAAPTEPADEDDVVEVTIRYTGAEARQLREVLDQLAYRSPEPFVAEMAKTNEFWLNKVRELGYRRRAA